MGIIGAPFEDWVEKQITERQNVYGASTRTPEQIQYMNNRGAWARLASSVDLSEEKAQELNIEGLAGKSLAQSFVLFNGVTDTRDGLNLSQGGIVPNQEIRNNILEASRYSYGLGSSEYGYTPPPGLDSVKIVHKNRGAIRQFDIKLKAQNIDQFNIIDALYLRLGYFLLIEWGHTSYFDTSEAESEYIANPEFFTPAFNSLFGGGDTDDILLQLKTHRETTSGNYDGGLVKVTNFSWNFNSDGTYDITISALSLGGLIDSLKLNFNGPNLTNYSTGSLEGLNVNSFPSGILLEDQNKTTINNFLLLNALKVKEQNWNAINGVNVYKQYNNALAINFQEENKPEQYYIPLSYLFTHINHIVLKLNHSNAADDNAIDNSKPLLRIGFGNTMFTHFFQNSSNPLVCLIPFSAPNPETGQNEDFLREILGNNFRTDNPFAGDIDFIHVNVDYIAQVLRKSVDQESGDMNLVLFLDNLMKGISRSLGNINNFMVSYDEVENLITILDDTIIPGANNQDPTELRIFGVKPGEQGSFVRNVSMQSKITNKIATQIAIGSTANNQSINESTSLLGRWNQGLTDRVQSKSDNLLTKVDENAGSDALEKLQTQYTEYFKFITDTYKTFKLPTSDTSGKAKQALPSILKYDLSVKTQNGNIPSKGFIPIDLSVEVDGISGVLQYQKFTVTPNILPPSYQEGVDFIIQGIDHTIAKNEWVTSYTTLSVARARVPIVNNNDLSFSLLQPPD